MMIIRSTNNNAKTGYNTKIQKKERNSRARSVFLVYSYTDSVYVLDDHSVTGILEDEEEHDDISELAQFSDRQAVPQLKYALFV